MITKQFIHAYVEYETYLELQKLRQKGKITVSSLVNQLLTNYLVDNDSEFKAKQEYLDELKTLESKKEMIHNDIALVRTKLMQIHEKETKEQKENVRKSIRMADAIQKSGAMEEFI